jgi:hypothetical protein
MVELHVILIPIPFVTMHDTKAAPGDVVLYGDLSWIRRIN